MSDPEQKPAVQLVDVRKSVDTTMMELALDQPLDREPGASAPELPQDEGLPPPTPGVNVRESVDPTMMEQALNQPLNRQGGEAFPEPPQDTGPQPPAQPTDSK